MSEKLVVLYQQMADLTAPECAGVGPGSCRVPHSCCDKMACDITKEFALRQGVTLPEYPPNHKGAYFLFQPTSPDDTRKGGCSVAPHLRPLCTVHTCNVNGPGFKPGDPKWTRKYFNLRERIDTLEAEEKRWDGIDVVFL